MSLVNQLIAATLAVMLGLAGGTIYIVSDSSKRMLTNQLESHALDTATHLGLYLAPYIASRDAATVETTVNAIFDSGFYQRINVVTADGSMLFSKTTPPVIGNTVPQWFVDLVELTPPAMTREVTYNWTKSGSIFVQGHPGYAYLAYWRVAQETLIWFLFLALISTLAISLILRIILRPLKGVEDQAIALTHKQYIEQPRIPKTRELRRVVEAMNQMVRQVHQMFEEQSQNIEELRRQAYRDDLTGLPNPRATRAQLGERLDYRQDFGPCALLYVHIDNLQALNQALGAEKTDNFIRLLASQLGETGATAGDHIIGRLGGADFALLLKLPPPDQLQRDVNGLLTRIDQDYQQLRQSETQTQAPVRIGIALGTDQTGAAQLQSNAHLGVEKAQQDDKRTHQFRAAGDPQPTDESWHEHVSAAIAQQQIFLQAQPVIATDERPLHQEVFARILNQDNNPCSAGDFISVVRELGLMIDMDRAVVNHALEYLQQGPATAALAINLSNESATDASFCQWLLERLTTLNQRSRLCIELNESSVLNNLTGIGNLRAALRTLGCSFGVDNFGVHPSGFGYLYKLQPDYIKIDGSLLHDIDSDAQDQFFVSSLVSVAHSLDIAAYAERVERPSQLTQLLRLKIDATQGFLHGTPGALE
ncbi:bifunctional diguanylate cyclase/phosphodiesterase [Marinobacterium rhizophilum]|uniref:EAL domain-containing protein n=1 Tax=Marinobacterium rhizophilum TaxID=420402 RepID=A0ABY5HQ27_9GAMM|nr:EAL domain-containing protein [Marinobacterium rhizophilum]UTW13309.1 EAL domain-containing protein [Marinobacterium rhizophilum]